MDPTLIAALARLGIKLGMNLIELLRGEGVTITDDDLRRYRQESRDAKARWDALAPGDDE